MAAPAVTPSGVRDGNPDALAALCAARGDAVLAYCEKVAGSIGAPAAAAEAFSRFRAEVVATSDLTALNPEALLINAARHAAARHAAAGSGGLCGEVPALLAARADRSISIANLERLENHLEGCWACRAPVARFQAADRAYRDPPGRHVPPDVARAIVAALAAAAPIRGQEPEPPAPEPEPPAPEPEPPPVASNGAGQWHPTHDMPMIAEPVQPPAPDYATTEFGPLDDAAYYEPFEPQPASEHDGAETSTDGNDRRGVVASAIAWLGLRPHGDETLSPTGSVPAADRGPGPVSAADRGPGPVPAADRRPFAGRKLPRPPRDLGPALPRGRAATALRPAALLPFALIAVALLIALLVAGVFRGGDPASTPQGAAPAVEPEPTGTTPDVVVVPNADKASAAAVELAKRRARAERRREAELASRPSPVQVEPAPTAPPPAAPPVAGAPAPPPPPPPPPPATDNASKPAGDGVTDPPPEQDPSSIPELAPPDDTTLPPG